MKTNFFFLHAAILGCLLAGSSSARAQGFTESDAIFYGEVRKASGGQAFLLQSGELRLTFVNELNAANRVTLTTQLRPTGTGDAKPYSYYLKVPLAYLPESNRMREFLSVGTVPTKFRVESITIDDVPATLPDGSKDFYSLTSASRASQNRLDLLVAGDNTDTDGDGIPDWWESLYELDPAVADAGQDPDEDGWSNLQEFQRGSDPNASNRDPKLVTTEFVVTESGEAGIYPEVLDSDTTDAGINVTVSSPEGHAFQLKLDGAPVLAGSQATLTLAELKSGCLTIRQQDRTTRQQLLPVDWNDGGENHSGQVMVRVVTPSAEDGGETALWLDGYDLPAEGSRVTSWPDRSGHGRPASQPLPDYQPIVTSNSADFSANAFAHLFFQDVSLPTGDHTVLAAYHAAESSDTAQTLFFTNRGYLQLAPTTQPISYPGAPIYQINATAVGGFENTSGTNNVSIFRSKTGVLQNIFGLSYDGENIDLAAIDPVLPTLGARRSAIPGGGDPVDQVFSGQIQEVLVFPTALPEQKLRGVNDYLHSKWHGAVIWDFSTDLRTITLEAGAGTMGRIVRGGFGDDQLHGGPGPDIISGGAGDDILSGGAAADAFVFGAVDLGRDIIADFDPLEDVVDVSALFWGATGDARQHVSVRLDTNFSTPVPTLDSVLIVTLPDASTMEIVLRDRVVDAIQLIQMITEGHLRMGGLSIPTHVQIELAQGSPAGPLNESLSEAFTVNVTRSGEGVAAALDVPLGFFQDAPGGGFVVDGANSGEGQRTVVSFARGETTKTLTFHPVPDLETTGESSVQVAVLPQFRYAVGGGVVTRTVRDDPRVWLEVAEPNAVVTPPQPARVIVHRDGSLTQSLVVDFQLGGTAENGVAINALPSRITLFAGQSSREIPISAQSDGLTGGPKVVFLHLAPRSGYVLGNPHEGIIYVGNTPEETGGAGFDRWLLASTQGAVPNRSSLARFTRGAMREHLLAYAVGLDSVDELRSHRMGFRIANRRPEISEVGSLDAADLRWTVQCSTDLVHWTDVGGTFQRMADAAGVRLVGPALASNETNKFYRVNMKLDPGESVGTMIAMITDASRYGIAGNANWETGSTTGDLISTGSSTGDVSRIVAEVTGPISVAFEMAIAGAGFDDRFAFYIDGVMQAQTFGAAVTVQQTIPRPGAHLLMWEFTKGTGDAVIRSLAP